ncbi:MAG: DUF5666 domain-containing protein [Burkholderiaceae bacterium]
MIAPARLFAAIAAIVVVIALAGCGGGLQAGVGSGGSGAPLSVGLGPVTGFGSIIVNGERYDESAAEVMVDERPDLARAATVTAIRLGMHAELQHRNLVVATALVAAELIGPVTSVSAGSFIALGQMVRVDADPARPTVFEGFDSLTDLASDAIVEVHGDRAGNGEILATRVERRPAGLAVVRVAGTATNVNGRNFSIGTLSVNASSATLVPAGATVANGQRVVAWTDVPYTGGALAAKVVRVGASAIAPNAAVAVDGVIGDFQGAASFRVSGVAVSAGQATAVTGGALADLRTGLSVRVRGTFTANVLNATSLEILQASQTAVHLNGPVTDFVGADVPFRIRNTLARVTPQTTYASGSASNLGNGAVVKATGLLGGGMVQVVTVEFLPLAPDTSSVVSGRIAAPISAIAGDGTRTFRLEGLKEDVKTTPGTTYRNGTSADVAAGRQVKVRGSLEGAQFVAGEAEFMDNPANPPTFEIEGTAGNVQPTSVVVNGQNVQLTPATTYMLDEEATTSASLRNGVEVEVVATRVGSTVTAVSIEIESSERDDASVRGRVSGRTPPNATSFMVGSQRVSVTGNPRVLPANKSLTDVVNGADIKVDGTVSNGVLNATRIQIK